MAQRHWGVWWGGAAPPPRQAPEIVLGARGGGGDAAAYETRMWLWPIPPEGPLTFTFRWLAQGVEETTVTVDAAPLRAASERAAAWWPEAP